MIAKREKEGPGRLYWIPFLLYFLFVVYGSLVPLQARYVPLDEAWERFARIRYLTIGIGSRSDLVANFLLFIPLSFLAMGVLTREGSSRLGGLTACVVLILSSGLSAGIEVVQVYFPARTVSLNDFFAECIGGFAGIVIWLTVGTSITGWVRGFWREHAQENLAFKILMGYLVGLLFYQLLPFDLTLSPVEMVHKYRQGKITMIPFSETKGLSSIYSMAVKAAIVVPLGFLLRLPGRRRWRRIIWEGFLIAAGIEFLQLFVYSRYTSTTDVAIGILGICAGAILANRFGPVAEKPFVESMFWRRSGKFILTMLPTVWIAGLAGTRWYPFKFRIPQESLSSRLRVPFYHQYMTTEFLASAKVTREFVMFFILGLLLEGLIACYRKNDRAVGIILLIFWAIVLEGGQFFVPTRVPDLTTAAIDITGGILGILAYPVFVRTFVRTKTSSVREGC